MSTKRFVNIKTSISADGLGVPVISIYFSYCDKKYETGYFCPMCHNKELQDDGIGFYLTFEQIIEIVDEKMLFMNKLLNKKIGICFLGGEPLAEINREMVLKISEYYNDIFQILYTWRMPHLIEDKWIKHFNKIVCGEYIEKLNKSDSYLLGSTNQIIINNKKEILLQYIK